MNTLKSFQAKVQNTISKGIDAAEKQHKAAADKSFQVVEKLETKVKALKIETVKAKHNDTVAKLYSNARDLNTKADKFTTELVAKVEAQAEKATKAVNEQKAKIEAQADKALKAINEQIAKIKGEKKVAKKTAAKKTAAKKPAAKKAAAPKKEAVAAA